MQKTEEEMRREYLQELVIRERAEFAQFEGLKLAHFKNCFGVTDIDFFKYHGEAIMRVLFDGGSRKLVNVSGTSILAINYVLADLLYNGSCVGLISPERAAEIPEGGDGE